ncbi:MAG: hypothetical protein MR693_04860, partial [Bacteroidales bacterium]|nr:hypothetical protein [Bacteroidales bacterium]
RRVRRVTRGVAPYGRLPRATGKPAFVGFGMAFSHPPVRRTLPDSNKRKKKNHLRFADFAEESSAEADLHFASHCCIFAVHNSKGPAREPFFLCLKGG